MTQRPRIQRLVDDPAQHVAIGESRAIRMTQHQTGFAELSAGLNWFTNDEVSPEWTTPYEEALYIIEGEVHLRTPDGLHVVGHAGDVLTIEKGTTVTYQGMPGSRLFFALTPANWMEPQA